MHTETLGNPMVNHSKVRSLLVALAVAQAAGCAYEEGLLISNLRGRVIIPEEAVIAMVGRFREAGIKRQYLAGSIGMEDPAHVNRLFRRLYEKYPDIELGFHIHNLSGMATANIVAAMDAGVHWLEGAICGIGGGMAIPTSVGKVGNYPMEDLVTMLEEMGVEIGRAHV